MAFLGRSCLCLLWIDLDHRQGDLCRGIFNGNRASNHLTSRFTRFESSTFSTTILMSISIQSFPTPDRLNISLVDGFCGGGSYRKNGEIEHGSPIILLKAVEAARSRLNSKPPSRNQSGFVWRFGTVNSCKGNRSGFNQWLGEAIKFANKAF